MRVCLWRSVVCLIGLSAVLQLAACGSASRASVRAEDMRKVFPWPSREKKVSIEVMPQTTMANTCSWLGSWERIEVGADTTFYITEKTGKKFAYTPSRSPIRRLAPVEAMEIRWPIVSEKAEPSPEGDKPQEDQGSEKQKAEKNEKNSAVNSGPVKSDGNEGGGGD
jgi:hypothetical protein